MKLSLVERKIVRASLLSVHLFACCESRRVIKILAKITYFEFSLFLINYLWMMFMHRDS